MSRSVPQISSDRPLGGRYKIISHLGVGGFGRTFLAQDLHLPGHPRCVIKQLKPQVRSDDTLQMARRCFHTEAQVLYQLGNHDQIPRLLAHFEDNQEFYLAQEFIEGDPLTKELIDGKPWTEGRAIYLMKDILQVLTFVHQRQVIHRDLKPSNLMRRRQDYRIVLIDFGAVKQVGAQNFDAEPGLTNITISIGTQGYMPNEQLAGKPRFSSDIYAVGILGIQALTGTHPRHLGEDTTGEVEWHDRVPGVSPELMSVLDRMVRYDFRERYPTAIEALAALETVPVNPDDLAKVYPPLPDALKLPYSDPGITIPPTDSNQSGQSRSGQSQSSQPYVSQSGQSQSSNNHSYPSQSGQSRSGYSQSGQGSGYGPSGQSQSGQSRSGQSQSGHQQPSHPGAEFSSVDLTLTDEEPLSTAIWVTTEEMIQPTPGSNTGGHGMTTGSTEMRTSATHAIGRPYPDEDAVPNSKKIWKRLAQPPVLLVAIVATGLAVVLVQAVLLPQLAQHFPSPGKGPSQSASPTPAPTPLNPKQHAEQLFNQANQLRNQKQYQQALGLYDQAIRLQPDYAEAYVSRCETLNQLKRPEEAIVSCNDALAYKSNYPEALWSKGNALLLEGRTYEALKLYEDVTYLKPDFANGWVKRGVALQKLGRSAEALNALDQGISIQRNSAEAWLTRGSALFNLQRYDEAITALDKTLQLQPDNADAKQLRQQAKDRHGSQ